MKMGGDNMKWLATLLAVLVMGSAALAAVPYEALSNYVIVRERFGQCGSQDVDVRFYVFPGFEDAAAKYGAYDAVAIFDPHGNAAVPLVMLMIEWVGDGHSRNNSADPPSAVTLYRADGKADAMAWLVDPNSGLCDLLTLPVAY